MTAGSFMYIGPQGIVHGTTITLLNAGRKYLGVGRRRDDLAGRVYVTSGLGGMSGAPGQGRRHRGRDRRDRRDQSEGAAQATRAGLAAGGRDGSRPPAGSGSSARRREGRPLSLGYVGNVVDLWEKLGRGGRSGRARLGPDLAAQPLRRRLLPGRPDPRGQSNEIDAHRSRNASSEARCGNRCGVRWPRSTRWPVAACASGTTGTRSCSKRRAPGPRSPAGRLVSLPLLRRRHHGADLLRLRIRPVFAGSARAARRRTCARRTRIAAEVLEPDGGRRAAGDPRASCWTTCAGSARQERHDTMVVGSQARILYSDESGRKRIALAFNDGDPRRARFRRRSCSGATTTTSRAPTRRTARRPTSATAADFCADMAVQNVIGDAFRGATWVSLHNGGGVGMGRGDQRRVRHA